MGPVNGSRLYYIAGVLQVASSILGVGLVQLIVFVIGTLLAFRSYSKGKEKYLSQPFLPMAAARENLLVYILTFLLSWVVICAMLGEAAGISFWEIIGKKLDADQATLFSFLTISCAVEIFFCFRVFLFVKFYVDKLIAS